MASPIKKGVVSNESSWWYRPFTKGKSAAATLFYRDRSYHIETGQSNDRSCVAISLMLCSVCEMPLFLWYQLSKNHREFIKGNHKELFSNFGHLFLAIDRPLLLKPKTRLRFYTPIAAIFMIASKNRKRISSLPAPDTAIFLVIPAPRSFPGLSPRSK